ncbi:MAG: hypothetical protein RMM17_14005 [Acidobacteriota bacterium]|nr:hypothetical protein [Blastocatellia bacterium]MDW8413782.1 hypothetical protein [Acidobacteriota bacterium]
MQDAVQHYFLADSSLSCYQDAKSYKPAAIIDCKLVFRSLRAGFHYTEERYFTTWFPENDLPADWRSPAIELTTEKRLSLFPPIDLPKQQGNWIFTEKHLENIQEELIDLLVRTEKLRVFHNPDFNLYSMPKEKREDFLERVVEKGLQELEQQLHELIKTFERKLEQIRESEERKGRKLDIDIFERLNRRSELLQIKSRLSSIFLNIGRQRPQLQNPSITQNDRLSESLDLIEQDAVNKVSELYSDFLYRTSQCYTFETGLQRQNIEILRRGVLWLPVRNSSTTD